MFTRRAATFLRRARARRPRNHDAIDAKTQEASFNSFRYEKTLFWLVSVLQCFCLVKKNLKVNISAVSTFELELAVTLTDWLSCGMLLVQLVISVWEVRVDPRTSGLLLVW